MRCKICGKRIKWDKSKLYMVKVTPSAMQVIAGGSTKVYDAMDCERCGSQNLINIRETNIVNNPESKLAGNNIEQFCVDEMSDEGEQE